jgi:alpha-glucoside transport system permease protein
VVDFLKTLVTIVVGLAVFGGVLSGLYWMGSFLPRRWRERAHISVFVGPAVFLLIIGLLIPGIRTIYMSVNSDDRTTRHFVGLKHYQDIFTDSGHRLVVINNLTWVIVGTIGTTLFALTVARFADGMKGEKVAKSMMFIPTAVSLAGAGIIWRFIYAAPPFKVGLLNQITKAIPGMPADMGGNGDQNWVLNRGFGGIEPPDNAPGFNTFLLIIIFIWASAGFSTVVLSAAVKGVPESLLEAARVDGATSRQAFYKVTLPYIRSTIVTVMTLTTIAGLKAFDIVEAVTGGNFGTSLLANEYLNTTYLQQREGLGSALAVLILLLVIPVVVINRRSQRRAEELMGA